MLNQLWNVDWNVDECKTDYEMLMNVNPTMKCWLSCWQMLNRWMLNWLWNVDWVVDECQTNYWHDQRVDVFSQVQECRSNK